METVYIIQNSFCWSDLYSCDSTIYPVVLCYSPGAIGLGGGLFREDDLPPGLTMVNCNGDEANLQECPSMTGNQDILSCDSAIVVCQGTYSCYIIVLLVNGNVMATGCKHWTALLKCILPGSCPIAKD